MNGFYIISRRSHQMEDIKWSQSELIMIQEAVDEHKRLSQAVRALSKVLMHRNARDIRRKALEVVKERNRDILESRRPKQDNEVEVIKAMVDDVDKAIRYLEDLKERIEELKSKEADFDTFIKMLHKLKRQ